MSKRRQHSKCWLAVKYIDAIITKEDVAKEGRSLHLITIWINNQSMYSSDSAFVTSVCVCVRVCVCERVMCAFLKLVFRFLVEIGSLQCSLLVLHFFQSVVSL